MKMLAYHNDPKLRDSVINEMELHRKADELVQGYGYWKDGKGCAVGCLIKSNNHAEYETRFGIPEMLARLEDTIFEGLPKDKAQKWPERFLSAISIGQDLSLVGWEFQHLLQINNLKFAKKQKFDADVIAAIEKVIVVLEPMTKGKRVDLTAARSAESAAWSAESAAWSAWSARSAARSAESAARSAESAARSAESAAWSARSAARSAESAARSAESAARSARSAARSAESAARSAESAAWSAESAARSAESAAWEEIADLLIEIIKQGGKQ